MEHFLHKYIISFLDQFISHQTFPRGTSSIIMTTFVCTHEGMKRFGLTSDLSITEKDNSTLWHSLVPTWWGHYAYNYAIRSIRVCSYFNINCKRIWNIKLLSLEVKSHSRGEWRLCSTSFSLSNRDVQVNFLVDSQTGPRLAPRLCVPPVVWPQL